MYGGTLGKRLLIKAGWVLSWYEEWVRRLADFILIGWLGLLRTRSIPREADLTLALCLRLAETEAELSESESKEYKQPNFTLSSWPLSIHID